MLKRSRHANLLNRVSVRYQLRPLTKEQTTRCIDFQMKQAGGDTHVFDDSVKAAIHDFTGGVLRQINSLATDCKEARIDEDLFHQASNEFQLP